MPANIIDPNLSNGTCWMGPRQPADEIYIPCGNDAYGIQPCCQSRDICLSSNACYNARWGVTYVAGCTDQSYTNDTVCPGKAEHAAQQWVGLVRCFVSNDTTSSDEEWVGCEDRGQPAVTSPDPCTCNTATDSAFFTDAPTLTAIASLPVSISNAIAWFSGFTPAATMTIDTADTASPQTVATITTGSQPVTASTTNNNLSPSPQGTNAASSHDSLSTPSKVGIGLGTGLAVVGIAILICWLLYRKRKKPDETHPSIMDQIRPRSQIDPAFHEKSNLDLRGSALSGPQSELDATEAVSPSATATLTSSSRYASSPQQYRAYNPHHSTISEVQGSPLASRHTTDTNKIVHELPG